MVRSSLSVTTTSRETCSVRVRKIGCGAGGEDWAIREAAKRAGAYCERQDVAESGRAWHENARDVRTECTIICTCQTQP
jgi:hypothetical protein